MSDIKQTILWPQSGLNYDDDERYMPLGDSKLRRNILIGEDESNGLITNMLGCVRSVDIADHELYLSNVYKVIGSYYNRLTRKVYYFIFSQPFEISSSGGSTSTTTTTTTESGDESLVIDYTAGDFQYDNMLLEYVEDTQELNVIFRDPKNYFGLHIDYPMRDLVMIGDWLYFNPRVSEPKMIDVVRAYNYTNYNAYDATDTYAYGEYVTFYGGLFRANTTVGVGETPSNTIAKWDKIGDAYQNESSLLNIESEFRYAFNVIKSPPKDRIVYSYGTDTGININNVKGRMFRFTHRYKYFDNSYSVFSAYSDVTLPHNDENYNGEVPEETPQLFNYIRLYFSPHSSALVKDIEVYFQEIGEQSNVWRRCKTINRLEQGILDFTENFTYDFYNNEAYEVYADPLQIAKVYDSVPRMAKAQELINKNILCYGGCTEGFDNIEKQKIDVLLTPELEAIVSDIEGTVVRDNITSGDITYETALFGTYYMVTIAVGDWFDPGDVNVGDYYVWDFTVGSKRYRGQLELTAPMLAGDNALAVALQAGIQAGGFADVTVTTGNNIRLDSVFSSYANIIKSEFVTGVADVTTLVKTTGFKTGAFHPFCIFYYDEALRRWDAQTSKTSENSAGYAYDGTTVYIPSFNELSPQPASTAFRWIVNWEVDHLPPTGAKYWRWGYAGNNQATYFVQYIAEGVGAGMGGTWNHNMIYINLTPLNTVKTTTETTGGAPWNQFTNSSIDPYQWEKGDRIRFITQSTDPAVPGTRLGALVDGIIDMEILGVDTTDANLVYVQYFDYVTAGLGENSLVEVYKPIREAEKTIYYEFGDLMPIVEESQGIYVHGGEDETHNQTSGGTPATGTFTTGDIYHIQRTPSKPLCESAGEEESNAFHESQWWSDFYDSSEWSKGKAGVETNFGERLLNIVRFSNAYLQDTLINGLPTFESDSYKELNDVFGNIVAIYEVGDTLKCYQERKASSILIGRTEYTDAKGNTTVAISSSVLGTVRYSPTNFSTVFPESIQRNNRYVYGFDIYNGVMWRDSANGIFPISGRFADVGGDVDYKMATWFKDQSKALLTSGIGHCDVMSVWDEEFKNLHVTFVDYNNEDNNETIVFHEPSNRWICFEDLHQTPPSYNIMVECLSYTILKGFEGGLGYSFDEDTRFACFNIVSPGNKEIEMDLITLGMTAYAPSATSDGVPAPDQLAMSMTAYTPAVHISYALVDVNNIAWTYDQYGSGSGQSVVITTTESSILVTGIPDWLTGLDETLHTIIEGVTTLENGETVTLYPTAVNSGADRTSSFVITDSYGNTATITVTQWGVPDVPEVTLEVKTGETFTITGSTAVNTYINNGSTQLHIGFTAHDLVLPGGVLLDVEIIKNATHYMWTNTYGRNEMYLTDTITLPDAASAGDAYVVILDEP